MFTVYNFQVQDYHTYFAAPTAETPLVWVHNANYPPKGFKSTGQFDQFGDATHGTLTKSGHGDAHAYFQGSAVTGFNHRGKGLFDVGRVSDFDIAISSKSLIAKARTAGVRIKTGNHTFRLADDEIEKLGLLPLRQKLSRLAGGRPVNFKIYETRNSIGGPRVRVPNRRSP